MTTTEFRKLLAGVLFASAALGHQWQSAIPADVKFAGRQGGWSTGSGQAAIEPGDHPETAASPQISLFQKSRLRLCMTYLGATRRDHAGDFSRRRECADRAGIDVALAH